MACPAKPGAAGSPMTTSETDTLPLGLKQNPPPPLRLGIPCSEVLCLQVYTHTKEWPGRELLSKP